MTRGCARLADLTVLSAFAVGVWLLASLGHAAPLPSNESELYRIRVQVKGQHTTGRVHFRVTPGPEGLARVPDFYLHGDTRPCASMVLGLAPWQDVWLVLNRIPSPEDPTITCADLRRVEETTDSAPPPALSRTVPGPHPNFQTGVVVLIDSDSDPTRPPRKGALALLALAVGAFSALVVAVGSRVR